MEQCRRCERMLPLSAFYPSRVRRRDWLCAECNYVYQRRVRAPEPTVSEKRCRSCGETKPADEFQRRRDHSTGLDSNCRECLRWKRAESVYGVTRAEFERTMDEQKGLCAGCRTDDWGSRYNMPHIDHDHRTGRFRGLLCWSCNSVLGMVNDDADTLRRLADYLDD